MTLNTLEDLLVEQLCELHQGEKHCQETMTKLAAAASSPKLAETFRSQAGMAARHVSRLDEVFSTLNLKPRRIESRGMKGPLKDCMKLAGTTEAEPHVRDAALIGVAQHVVHDEIAGYGCARTWADLLGKGDAARQLQDTLAEERKADKELTGLAEAVNKAALEPTSA